MCVSLGESVVVVRLTLWRGLTCDCINWITGAKLIESIMHLRDISILYLDVLYIKTVGESIAVAIMLNITWNQR